MKRRTFLAVGLSTGVVLAGCSGTGTTGGGGGEGGTDETGEGAGDETGAAAEATATPTAAASNAGGQSLADHPAATDLGTQPTLGPAPGDATAVIVAYEDPSCPRCARFETEIVPQLRSEYVASGDLSIVFRGYPVVYEWGQHATRALEAVFDRSADAHWALAEHYFRDQDAFRSGGLSEVYPKTRSFLAESTDLDAEAVVGEAEDGAHDASVQTDLDAGMAAGAGRTTPHLFLFRDGTYRTKATGYVSREVLTSALQL
jgi:protein-disulfide isomerase